MILRTAWNRRCSARESCAFCPGSQLMLAGAVALAPRCALARSTRQIDDIVAPSPRLRRHLGDIAAEPAYGILTEPNLERPAVRTARAGCMARRQSFLGSGRRPKVDVLRSPPHTQPSEAAKRESGIASRAAGRQPDTPPLVTAQRRPLF